MKYLSFDLETALIMPEGATNWREHRPLGITCAAFAWLGNGGDIRTMAFHGRNPDGSHAAAMSRDEAADLVRKLQSAVEKGSTILTWNGLGFDFEVLAEESGLWSECADLALRHVDMMYQILCIKGFPLGVDAAAKGLGLGGKTEGVNGAAAPQLWAEQEYEKVLEYVQNDTRIALQVAMLAEERHAINWTTQKGKRASVAIDRWKVVTEANKLPVPDTSWMTNPLTREGIMAWTLEAI